MPPMHARILRTLYRKITGVSATKEVPLSGRHWETIGFRPRSRSRSPRRWYAQFAADASSCRDKTRFVTRMWLQSQDSTRGFPLMATSIPSHRKSPRVATRTSFESVQPREASVDDREPSSCRYFAGVQQRLAQIAALSWSSVARVTRSSRK